MQKTLEYEQHAAKCRRMAAEMTTPQLKKQLEDAAGQRVTGAWRGIPSGELDARSRNWAPVLRCSRFSSVPALPCGVRREALGRRQPVTRRRQQVDREHPTLPPLMFLAFLGAAMLEAVVPPPLFAEYAFARYLAGAALAVWS
jgi:hypothetical protein